MSRHARLITPGGRAIELPDEVYREVRRLLRAKARRRSRAKAVRLLLGAGRRRKG